MFQEKDKDRFCLEYAPYQRELKEMATMLEENKEERSWLPPPLAAVDHNAI